jgi:hypothetical protein
MRLVHEVHYSTQVSVQTRGPYGKSRGNENKPHAGFPIEVMITVCNPPGLALFRDDVPIEIEGDAAMILDACYQIIEGIICNEAVLNEQGQTLAPKWKDAAKKAQAEWQRAVKAERKKREKGSRK